RKEGTHHLLVHRVGAQALTHRVLRLPAQRITEILIAAFILHHHFVPTTTAIDQALEQGRPLARYPTTFVVLIGGIVVIDNPLNAFKRLPRNVGRVTVVHDHLPLGYGLSTLLGTPTARWHLALRFAIRKGARIGRIAQDRNHCRHSGGAPHRFA